MNREVQRNTPGGWLSGLALAPAHAGKHQEIDADPPVPGQAPSLEWPGVQSRRRGASGPA